MLVALVTQRVWRTKSELGLPVHLAHNHPKSEECRLNQGTEEQ